MNRSLCVLAIAMASMGIAHSQDINALGNHFIAKAVYLSASQSWVDTEIELGINDTVEVQVRGMASSVSDLTQAAWSGPEGRGIASSEYPLPGYPAFSCIGRVGAIGEPFYVGSVSAFRIQARGRLSLGVNDWWTDDNLGGFVAHIFVKRIPTSWQCSIAAFDACNDTLRPVFGQAPFATDCIDSLYGEAELPPPPPSGGFDVRFRLPCGSSASLKDFRSDSPIEQRFTLKLQACSNPITLRWDTTGFPDGCFYIRDSFGGVLVNVNMRTQTELSVPPAVTELWIERTESMCRTMTTHAGWNMLSVPAHVSPNHYLDVFPDATSHPFRFTPSGYVLDDTLKPGIGYWVKFLGVNYYDACGCTDVGKSVSVAGGWNMIGPFEDVLLASGVTSEPGGIVVSPFYHYFPPYDTVDSLLPGKAYWVKVNQAGVLYISSNSGHAQARSSTTWSLEAPPSPPDGETPRGITPIEFSLEQNYPNPFNPSTTIRFALPTTGFVSLKIFDQLGREVRTLVDEVQAAGFKSVEWNSTNNGSEYVASGVYFYRLQSGEFVQTRKLLLLR